jgi:serine phosphatase RsbU (regulator of sigma subunit)
MTSEKVKQYREKLGQTFIEMNRSYTQKKRQDPEYYEKEKEKNRIRNAEKRRLEKLKKQQEHIDNNFKISYNDKVINNLVNIPMKKQRGRPRMSDEQKAEAKQKRDANKYLS